MKKSLYIIIILLFPVFLSSQHYTGAEAGQFIERASEVSLSDKNSTIEYIKFKDNEKLPLKDLELWLSKALDMSEDYSLTEINTIEDKLGYEHKRLQLNYQGVPLLGGILLLHIKDGYIESLNGNFPFNIQISNSFSLTKEQALNQALQFVGADTYMWELPGEEQFIKNYTADSSASFYPQGEQAIVPSKVQGEPAYFYTYKFDIYAHKPVYRADVYIDASSGEVLLEDKTIHHADTAGTANTKYSGTRNITTDYYNGSFRLRESGRGNGIETYDMNNSTTYFSAVDFTDTDNYWNNYNTNLDEVAGDAHWGAEKTYDYYFNEHNRNSIDGNGMTVTSYIHYDVNYVNAFWNGQYMTYGDGNGSSITPLTALDIVAHEITHGVTSYTADLIYQDESGALNEGFSDIFAATVEAYARPNNYNWAIGEDIGVTLRAMDNPNAYQLPDTYYGNHWYTGTGDNGGVHTNMGVLSYWFYLLTEGGSGVNDNNDSYSVTGIGMDSAAAIAYRLLSVYLTPSSEYDDARFYAIKAATDLYGSCSQAVNSTTNAMYAVGVGPAYIPGVQADFSAGITSFCQPPATVTFNNLSNNGSNFYWDFGDGNFSSDVNPTHTYTQYGDYTVSLIADGGSCGTDTLIDTAFISIDTANPCQTMTPQSGNLTVNNCNGFLYDDGGPDNNYSNNSSSSVTIAPTGASSLSLTFNSFDFEAGYDYLNIYEGTSTSGTLLGSYDGNSLPNNGNPIISNTGAVTIEQETDVYVTESGFALEWQCTYPNAAPNTDFAISDTFTCQGEVQFNDLSFNGPTNWTWDFGDGNTSSQQNPVHQYNANGVYDVKLVTTNSFGTDSLILPSVVKVKMPDTIMGDTLQLCKPGNYSIQTNANGTVEWYSDAGLNNMIDTGSTITFNALTNDTTVYATNAVNRPTINGAKADNSGGGGYFTAAFEHYMVFDAFQDFTLTSVKVYAGSAGNRTIVLRNSNGVTVDSKTVNIAAGEQRIDLDFYIPAGSAYELAGPQSPDLYRNNNGLSFPYAISNLASVTSSSASSDPYGYYYYFYDWEVQPKACSSPRATFDIKVYNNTPVADFDYQANKSQVIFNNLSSSAASYSWNFGDGNLSDQQNPTHSYSQTGSYDVKLLIENPCGIDSITKTIVITETSIENHAESSITIYPNPAKNILTIKMEGDQKAESIVLMDLNGKQIARKHAHQTNDQKVVFNLKQLDAGVYIIRLRFKDYIYTKKVVVL